MTRANNFNRDRIHINIIRRWGYPSAVGVVRPPLGFSAVEVLRMPLGFSVGVVRRWGLCLTSMIRSNCVARALVAIKLWATAAVANMWVVLAVASRVIAR